MGIPYTPHTPGHQKALAILIIAFMPVSASLFAQQITLDSVTVYEQAYRSYLQQRWKAERAEFIVTTRKKWWYYLPSVGYSLRSPLVQVNTGILAQIDRDKLTMAARLESLDARYQVEFVETVQRIRVEYRKLVVRREQLERERQLLSYLRSIQAIHTEAATNPNPTMTPEQRIQSKHGFEVALSTFQAKAADWDVAVLDFFALCRYELPELQLIHVAQADCGLMDRQSPHPYLGMIDVVTIPKR